jgi:hypothetical protein
MKKVKQEPNAVESFLGLKMRVFEPVKVPDKNFFHIGTSELCERHSPPSPNPSKKNCQDFRMIFRDLAWLGVTFFQKSRTLGLPGRTYPKFKRFFHEIKENCVKQIRII